MDQELLRVRASSIDEVSWLQKYKTSTTNLKVGSSQNWGCHIREKVAGGMTLDGMYLREEI